MLRTPCTHLCVVEGYFGLAPVWSQGLTRDDGLLYDQKFGRLDSRVFYSLKHDKIDGSVISPPTVAEL